MNNKVVAVVIGVVLVVALGGIVMMKKPSVAPDGSGNGSDAPAAANTGSKSIKELMAIGGTQKCTFSSEDDTSRSSGVVYFSGGKMRGDYESLVKAQGETVQSHSISDGEYMFTWSSEMDQGVKVKFADFTADGNAAAPQTQGQSMNYDQSVNYDCDSWSADASLFIPPATVSFLDASALMQGALGGASVPPAPGRTVPGEVPSGAGGQCAVCDSAPDPESKAQCKLALGCE